MLGNKSIEELQEIFEILDEKLHESNTCDSLKDKIMDLESEIDELKDEIEMIKDNSIPIKIMEDDINE